jgi:putative ABC transport system permease protein
MGAFAGLALLMAAVGIYGLIAYLVGRRTHEIGVRMALGARRSEVFRLVLRNAMSMALTGVAIGFLISLALPRLVVASFSGFHVRAAWILAGAPLAVTLVALASCYTPARRASRVDPMVALRYE